MAALLAGVLLETPKRANRSICRPICAEDGWYRGECYLRPGCFVKRPGRFARNCLHMIVLHMIVLRKDGSYESGV